MRYAASVLLATSVITQSAHAQSSALAEQLFNEARELTQANRWAEACPKFEASLRYDPVLGTRLNLAVCYEHIGKLASAWGLYRDSIELAGKAGDVKKRDYAHKHAAALEPRLPKLTIFAPTPSPNELVVKRDGAPINAGELGVALPVDPGAHEITASAPGFGTFTQIVTAVEGKTETLAIPALVPKPVMDPTKSAVKDEVDMHGTSSRARRYVAISIGAAGVAAVGVGLIFGLEARSTFSEAKKLCGEQLVCTPANYDKGKQLFYEARSSATVSTVLVVAGSTAIVAGAVVFLTAPREKEHATAHVTPIIQDHGLGLGIIARF